jgi:hypothetical protein
MAPAVVNIATLKGRFIAHKFSTGWTVGVAKSNQRVWKRRIVLMATLQSSISQKRTAGLKH